MLIIGLFCSLLSLFLAIKSFHPMQDKGHSLTAVFFRVFQYAKKKTVQCLFYGAKCEDISLIPIAPMGRSTEATCHTELDIFSWSPGIPHYTKDFVELGSNCYVLAYDPNQTSGPNKGECYVYVHYDQVRI